MREEWLEDLDAYLGADAPEEPPAPANVDPHDMAGANRLVRSLAAAERHEAEILAVASDEISRIRSWAAARVATIAGRREWAEAGLEAWMRAQAAETKRKTVTFSQRVLRLRPGRPKVVIDNEETAVKWAEEHDHPGWIDRKVTIRRAEVIKGIKAGPLLDTNDDGAKVHSAVTTEGELVAGLAIAVPGRDGFTIGAVSHPKRKVDGEPQEASEDE